MSAMKVDVRHVEDVIIVDLEGRLVMGVGDELLREVMNELIAEDWKKILLNLRKVTIIDSSGIGEVVSSWIGWLHGVVIVHWLVGGIYSGVRMLTTDPVGDMLIRRIFALEAWFCFAVLSFYVLWVLSLRRRRV